MTLRFSLFGMAHVNSITFNSDLGFVAVEKRPSDHY